MIQILIFSNQLYNTKKKNNQPIQIIMNILCMICYQVMKNLMFIKKLKILWIILEVIIKKVFKTKQCQ